MPLPEAGFTGIRADVVGTTNRFDDPRAFARGLIYGTPLIEQLRARGGADPERLLAALQGEYERLRHAFRMQAIVFEAS